MADITLTPAEVAVFVPGATVLAADITDAANHIYQVTGWTVTEHSDEATDGVREIPESQVKRAWAIVSARLQYLTAESTTGGIVQESDADSSYTINPDELNAVRGDLLTGVPRKMLLLNAGNWHRVRS